MPNRSSARNITSQTPPPAPIEAFDLIADRLREKEALLAQAHEVMTALSGI